MDWVQHMFGLSLPLIEKVLWPILVYLFLIIGLRVAGKRELAQLNPFDLVVLLTLSNTVQNAIIGEDTSVLGGVVGATTLLGVNRLVVRAVHHNRHLSDLIEGKPDHFDPARKNQPHGAAARRYFCGRIDRGGAQAGL